MTAIGLSKTLSGLLAVAAIATGVCGSARAETVEVYSAGSLTKVVEALAHEGGALAGVAIKPTFGSAGRLRERIEAGETPDLFLSADMASPRKLAAEGRAVLPAVAFAGNRMCLIARRSVGVTPGNMVERMLSKDNRLKASTPIADPGGDYAVEIFDRIDASHKGAGQILRDKTARVALSTQSAQPLAGHGATTSLFLSGQIDMMISYCSGAAAIEQEAPTLVAVAFPPALEPRPVDGLVVLSAKPGALRLALYLMSDRGQAIVKAAGLLPLSESGAADR